MERANKTNSHIKYTLGSLFTRLTILSKKEMELVWQKVFVVIISFIFTFSHSFNLFHKEFKEVYKALRQNKFISRKQRKGKIMLPKQDGARNAISTWLDILFAPLILFPLFSARLTAPASWASPPATGFTEF